MAVPLFNLAPNLTDSESDSSALPLILKYIFILRRDDDFRRAKHVSGVVWPPGPSFPVPHQFLRLYRNVSSGSASPNSGQGRSEERRFGHQGCKVAMRLKVIADRLQWPDRYVPMFGEIEYDPTRKFSSIPIDEQLDALGIAVDSGKIRYVGLSNETPYGVMKFVQVAARHPKIVSVTHTACSVELLILGWLNAVIMRRIQSVGFQKK
ncbi:uncharacterized protein LOC110760134 [Prunus avium]|uniref:Uncharacterized protein LOC110760134 n=1 Tax=Prunus avium TaxID=42229 RepID=A0A6P5SMA6_PRUAV|nr:uncharacterized protein LOC110760134 [Prunus avium]